jgi:hypothetical protein
VYQLLGEYFLERDRGDVDLRVLNVSGEFAVDGGERCVCV